MSTGSYADTQQASIETGTRADYDDLKDMKEGEAIISFAMDVLDANIFYSNPGHAKAMRVTRYLALPEPDETLVKHSTQITKLRDLLCSKDWTAQKADVNVETPEEIQSIKEGYVMGMNAYDDPIDYGIIGLCDLHAKLFPVEAQEAIRALSAPTVKAEPTPPETTQEEKPQPETVAPSVAKQTKEPVSWASLNETAEETAEPKPQIEVVTKQLSGKVKEILSEAGTALRKSLIKSKETPDAAE
jgi:intracellular multiplication protein IcmO